jgi:hypothetical protein
MKKKIKGIKECECGKYLLYGDKCDCKQMFKIDKCLLNLCSTHSGLELCYRDIDERYGFLILRC